MVSSAKYPSLGFVATNIILGIGAVILVAVSFSGPSNSCVFGHTDAMPRGNPGVCALATATGFIAFCGTFIAVTLALFMDELKALLRVVAAMFACIMLLWCLTSAITAGYLAQTCRNVGSCTSLEGYDEASAVVGLCWINLALWVLGMLYVTARLYSNNKQEVAAAEAAEKVSPDAHEAGIRARIYARHGRGKQGEYSNMEFGLRHPFVSAIQLLLACLAIVVIGLSFAGPSQCFYGRSSNVDAGIGGICALVSAMAFVGLVSSLGLWGYAVYSAGKDHWVLPKTFFKWTSSATFFLMLLWGITSIIASAGLANTCKNIGNCKTTAGYNVTGWAIAFCWINTVVWALAFIRYGMLFATTKDENVEDEVAMEVKKERDAEKEIQQAIEEARRARSPPVEEEKLAISVAPPRSYSPYPFEPSPVNRSASPSPRTARLYEEAEAIRREAEQRAKYLNEEQERFERFAAEDRERARQIAREEQIRQQRFEDETRLWQQRMEQEERRRKERYAEEDERQRVQYENDLLRRQAQKQSDLRSLELGQAERQLSEERALEARVARALLQESAADRLAQEAIEAETRRRQEAHARAASEDHRRLLEEELMMHEQKVGQMSRDIAHSIHFTLHVPRLAQPALAQIRQQVESRRHVSVKVVHNSETSFVTVTGAEQTHVYDALKDIEDTVNEQIRKDFGQAVETDETPEYLAWLGKRGNLPVILSKIYDQYPQVLQIKRVFDSADSEEGGGRGFLDRQQLITSFEELFPACKRGHGVEFGGYLYDVLMAQPGPKLEGVGWKDFIFYCLSRRLIVLEKKKKR